MNIILPKTHIKEIDRPLIFLAGPIRSTINRQNQACEILLRSNSNIMVASPRRIHEVSDFVKARILQGEENYFPRQRVRENHYLERAAHKGVILFRLPGEEKHNCNKVYGAMTRLELGERLVHHHYKKDIKICIGSDGSFPELDTIKVDIHKYAPDQKIRDSLEKVCKEALKIINS